MFITAVFTSKHKVSSNYHCDKEQTNECKPPRMIKDRETIVAITWALHESGIV